MSGGHPARRRFGRLYVRRDERAGLFWGKDRLWGIASAYEILYVRTPCSLRNDSMLIVFPNVAMNPRTECFCH
jgi:hypothetical protein